jgi:nitrite reductase/ring-hydroxylating ferredoxin subunit
MAIQENLIRVASLSEIKEAEIVLAKGTDRPVAVFYHDGKVSAVDNRCPHLGFPLHRGTVRDGLLTCHWHEARFDLCSGCTFDLWADDVPAYEVVIEGEGVFVAPQPRHTEDADYYWGRLEKGLQHNISLIQAKAILGLRKNHQSWAEIIKRIALYGTQNHDFWGEGMTLLTIVGNLAPYLSQETMYFALTRASRQVARDCSRSVPRRPHDALDQNGQDADQLKRWMRHWIQSRHRGGAERVLLSGIQCLGESDTLADIIYAAASDRVYSDTGHIFDATNKSLELLDLVSWDFAEGVLPLTLQQMSSARGAEENAHWHHPIELIEPLRTLEDKLPKILKTKINQDWKPDDKLQDVLLSDDMNLILEKLQQSLLAGAPPMELSKRVTLAAAFRLAKYATTNEVSDWFNPRHTFIFCNAVHQAVKRSPSSDVIRGIFHGALSVFMDRFLNVPPARLPKDSEITELPDGFEELKAELLGCFDRHANVTGVTRAVSRYIRLGHPVDQLVDILTLATVREDIDFHTLQVLEAAVKLSKEIDDPEQIESVFVGVARQLAAICPTPRASHQRANVASRLERGDKIYENDMA